MLTNRTNSPHDSSLKRGSFLQTVIMAPLDYQPSMCVCISRILSPLFPLLCFLISLGSLNMGLLTPVKPVRYASLSTTQRPAYRAQPQGESPTTRSAAHALSSTTEALMCLKAKPIQIRSLSCHLH